MADVSQVDFILGTTGEHSPSYMVHVGYSSVQLRRKESGRVASRLWVCGYVASDTQLDVTGRHLAASAFAESGRS